MSKSREILRLRWVLEHTVRAVAKSVGVSTGAVSQAVSRASRAGLTWASVEEMDDAALEAALYAVAPQAESERSVRSRTRCTCTSSFVGRA